MVPLGKHVDTGVENPNGYTLNYNGKYRIKNLSRYFPDTSSERFFNFFIWMILSWEAQYITH